MQQILKPRAGHKGLTNRACLAWNDENECLKYEIQEYLLEDAEFRETVNSFDFICSIGGRRFKVCKDKPGFCRITYTDCGIFCRRKRHEEYIPAEKYDFLLAANTRCMNKEEYPLGGVE